MQKIFVEPKQVQENIIKIVGTDVNHIKNVLRMKKEEMLQICVEQTCTNYLVKIKKYEKDVVECEIIEKIISTVESNIQLTIFQGLPKADKMEWIIQKTTEVGVVCIVPVKMKRSIVKIDEKEQAKKIDRWQKIAKTATEQSKRDRVPKIEMLHTLQEVVDKIPNFDIFLVAYEEENTISLKQILKEKKETLQNIGILIGPEGGIDEKELQLLYEKGAIVVTLGKRILRTETAPIVMSSNIFYELEE